MTDFADRVVFLREKTGLTQARLAKLAGLSVPTIGHWERGARKDPDGNCAANLARATGASLEWLISGNGEPPSDRAIRRAIEAATRAGAAKKRAA